MSALKDSYRHTAETLKKSFEKRNMKLVYCETSQDAVSYLKKALPSDSTVSWGGSETLNESGVMDLLNSGTYRVLNRKDPDITYSDIVSSDYFFMSTNAFTLDGELVNIDGFGNRVACLICGPSNVIVVAGMNKLCKNTEEAISRIHVSACPPNAIRVGASTPCSKTGVCADCTSPDCICCQTVITRFSRIPDRITVLLIGETLGF